MPAEAHFSPAFFGFLRGLDKNNDRGWFQAHKADYEEHVKRPMQRFIADLRPRMAKVSSRIDMGLNPGSVARLNRDTRFSKDKSPYKTTVSARFGHAQAGELLLGYHISLEPGEVLAYFGIWEPPTPVLDAIRARIIAKPEEWKAAAANAKFRVRFAFKGESLKRPPKDVDPGHPFIEDLKRKSHAAAAAFTEKEACARGFIDEYVECCRAGKPLMGFVCKAVGVAW